MRPLHAERRQHHRDAAEHGTRLSRAPAAGPRPPRRRTSEDTCGGRRKGRRQGRAKNSESAGSVPRSTTWRHSSRAAPASHVAPTSSAHAAIPTHRCDRDVRVHREAVGHRPAVAGSARSPRPAPADIATARCRLAAPAGAPGVTAVAQMTRAPAATASANMAASAPRDFRAPGKLPRHSSQTSNSGNAAHSSLASSAAANHATAAHGRPSSHCHSAPKQQTARQHDAARPDVIHRLGLDRMQGEEQRPRSAPRAPAAGAAGTPTPAAPRPDETPG